MEDEHWEAQEWILSKEDQGMVPHLPAIKAS